MSKKDSTRKISIFYFLIFLIITSLILVIYINNIIYVNQLTISNASLKEEISKAMQANDMMRAEADKLGSYDRIKVIALEKFNLSYKDNSVDEARSIIIKKSDLK